MNDILIESKAKSLLEKYNKLLVEKNKFVNLTAHKTEAESWRNNIIDSLLFLEYFPKTKVKALDIGSGCGCPAVPLKILLPELDMTMLDSVNKKTEFLNEVTKALGLENISAVHARIEDFAVRHRESFDLVTARAVADLPVLLEYALPCLKTGGQLFAFKGKNWQEEIGKSKRALAELGGEITAIWEQTLDQKQRALIIIKKVKSTDKKYPRGKNLPRLKPII